MVTANGVLFSIVAPAKNLLLAFKTASQYVQVLLNNNVNILNSFVGTTPKTARAQLEILKQYGLEPQHKLIEFGCGALNGSAHIINYLSCDNYSGVDPNAWLRNLRTLLNPRIFVLRLQKRPTFHRNSTFSIPKGANGFDYVFAHSVLSHTSKIQLEMFFASSRQVLNRNGIVIASYRDSSGNRFGSEGSLDGKDNFSQDWVYPSVAFFSQNTLQSVSAKYGFRIKFEPSITSFITQTRPKEFHDWFIAEKI